MGGDKWWNFTRPSRYLESPAQDEIHPGAAGPGVGQVKSRFGNDSARFDSLNLDKGKLAENEKPTRRTLGSRLNSQVFSSSGGNQNQVSLAFLPQKTCGVSDTLPTDVLVHSLGSLPSGLDPRNFDLSILLGDKTTL